MEKETINLDLFSPKKAELQKAADQYKDLKIEGLDDKKGYELVHKAQMELRSMRTGISKTRLDYTRQFDEAKKKAIGLEKELLEIITPVEEALKEQKEKIDAEKERIKQEELEKKRKFLQDRVDALASVGYSHHDLHALSQMTQEDFQELLDEKSHEFNEQQKKLEEERLLEKKNHYKSAILRSTTLEEIDQLEKDIAEVFDIEEFKQDIDAKRGMIEQQSKLDAQQKKIDEENAKIQAQKDKEAQEKREKELQEKARKEGEQRAKEDAEKRKLATDQEIEEIGKINDLWKTKEKLMLHTSCSPHVYDKERLLEFIKERIAKLEEIEEQEKLEKETKYKKFLKKNEGNFDKIVKEEGKVILYKIIDEFSL